MDEVIAGYRELTGKAPILPKWAYGFWQSRQRYETQDQLLGVLHEYRKRGLPLDNIVQDWLYWPQDQWGCQCFDTARFPDPKAMVDDVHANGAHVDDLGLGEISTRASRTTRRSTRSTASTTACRTRARTSRRTRTTSSAMYLDWVGPGYFNAFYDPYNPAARDLYWSQVRDGHRKQGLRRLVARFRRARFPLEHLARGNRAAHGPDRAGPARTISTPIRSRMSTASTTTRSPTSPTSGRSS